MESKPLHCIGLPSETAEAANGLHSVRGYEGGYRFSIPDPSDGGSISFDIQLLFTKDLDMPDASWFLERLGSNKQTFELKKKIVTVGRTLDADLICDEKKVSRKHGEFHFRENQWFVKDLRSLNGVFVNGTKISQDLTPLNPNDTVGFGALNPDDGYIFALRKQETPIKVKGPEAPAASTESLSTVKHHSVAAVDASPEVNPSASTSVEAVVSDVKKDEPPKTIKLTVTKGVRRESFEERPVSSDSEDDIMKPRKKWKKIIISETDDSDFDSGPSPPVQPKPAPLTEAELVKKFALRKCTVVLQRLTEEEIRRYRQKKMPRTADSSFEPASQLGESQSSSSLPRKKKRKRQLSSSSSESDIEKSKKIREKAKSKEHERIDKKTKEERERKKLKKVSNENITSVVGKKENRAPVPASGEPCDRESSGKKARVEPSRCDPLMPVLQPEEPISAPSIKTESKREVMTVQPWARNEVPTVVVKPQPRDSLDSALPTSWGYSQPESPEAAAPVSGVYSQLENLDEDVPKSPREGSSESSGVSRSPLYDSDEDIFILDEFIVDPRDHFHIKEEPVDKPDEAEYEEELLRWAERLSQDVPSVKVKEEPQTQSKASATENQPATAMALAQRVEPARPTTSTEAREASLFPEKVREWDKSPAKAGAESGGTTSREAKQMKTEPENEEQWWPDLSQAFHEEERREQNTAVAAATATTAASATARPLIRPKPAPHRTMLTEALPLASSSLHRRLVTAGAVPTAPSVPAKDPHKKRSVSKSCKKAGGMREKLKKDHGLTGYTASVKAGVTATSDLAVLSTRPAPSSSSKARTSADHPSGNMKPAVQSTKPGPAGSGAAADAGAHLMPPPAAAPVKAKVTQRNRSSFLTDTPAPPPAAVKKKKPLGGMANYRIPKKGATDANDNLQKSVMSPVIVSPSIVPTIVPHPPPKEKAATSLPAPVPSVSPVPKMVGTVNPILKAAAPPNPMRRLSGERPIDSHIVAQQQTSVPEAVPQRRVGILLPPRDEAPGVERSSIRPAVRFSEQTEVRPIPSVVAEARAAGKPVRNVVYPKDIPRNARPVTDPAAHNMCSSENVLLRIYNWSPAWLTEQKSYPDPPPILAERKGLVGLNALPVLSTYKSVASYLGVFFPLVLHEFWEELTREHDFQLANQRRSVRFQVKDVEYKGDIAKLICWAVKLSDDNVQLMSGDVFHLDFESNGEITPRFASVVAHPVSERATNAMQLHTKVMDVAVRQRQGIVFSTVLHTRIAQKKAFRPGQLIVGHRLGNVRSVFRYVAAMRKYLVTSSFRDLILEPKFEDYRLKPMAELSHKQLAPQVGFALNPSQLEAVLSISDAVLTKPEEPKICLLQGPPGTGKSHTIVALVLQMLHTARTNFPRILLCAPSNAAVDEIVYRLQLELRKLQHQHFSMVRVGVLNSISSRVRRSALDNIVDSLMQKRVTESERPVSDAVRDLLREEENLQHKCGELIARIENLNKEGSVDQANVLERQLQGLRQKRQSVIDAYNESVKSEPVHENDHRGRKQIRMDVLRRANIVTSTLMSSANETVELYSREKIEFLCCIIDEASQCTEPESLLPLAYKTKKLVFVGDPEQLPATVQSQIAEKKGYNRSLFSRIHGHLQLSSPTGESPGLMLDTQYRMHPDICSWPSRYFYGNRLQTSSSIQRGSPLVPYKLLNILDSREVLQEKEISNPDEANVVANLVRGLTTYEPIRDMSIGVITFYRRQCGVIKSKIKEQCGDVRVEVSTVDGFQGQERDIIILSCVRTDEKTVGFVAHYQRLNVALTRARYSMIICGNIPALSKNQGWKQLIEDAHSRDVTKGVTTAMSPEYLLSLVTRNPNPH